MRELSLFTGAGGGLLASKHMLGWHHRGYVENNDHRQRCIRQRIADGVFDNAPTYGNIRAFVSEGYARSYQGMVDVVTAGFPCQPFSAAGKRLGARDPRNMWPATIAAIREIRPRFVYLENSPRLRNPDREKLYRLLVPARWQWVLEEVTAVFPSYYGRVLGDLAESGYDVVWRLLSAAELGAPHLRKRLWIVAYRNGTRELQPKGRQREQRGRISDRVA